jgi:hemerythrin
MALIEWSDEHKVNVREIDEQHRQLVALVNNLHEAMKNRGGSDTIRRRVADLVLHTRGHFSFEERLMSDHSYPDFERHKTEHEKLLGRITDLERQVQEGDLLMSFGVALDLRGWALRHIEFSDRLLGAFLNSRGVF